MRRKPTTPRKGDSGYKEYIKKQWQYKKDNFTNMTFMLRNDADKDLIFDLSHFDGVRSQWLRDTIRKALKEEGRNKFEKSKTSKNIYNIH